MASRERLNTTGTMARDVPNIKFALNVFVETEDAYLSSTQKTTSAPPEEIILGLVNVGFGGIILVAFGGSVARLGCKGKKSQIHLPHRLHSLLRVFRSVAQLQCIS
jgi:hypothetical protein